MTKFPAVFDVDNLNGKNGFKLTSSTASFGESVAGTGDINGDGRSDIIVGAANSNKAYVIFGTDDFSNTFDTADLNGSNGFTLISSAGGFFGLSASRTGDINGDGRSDLIIGAYRAQKAYVIFGANKFPAIFDTLSLNGGNGFILTSSSDGFGSVVAGTGDINGDGKFDLIIGTWVANKAYVIFGSSNFPVIFDTSSLNGVNGFTLVSFGGTFGGSVSGLDDINLDGKSDLIIGAPDANKAYVIFGSSNFPAIFDISDLNGANGFTLTSSSTYFGGSLAGLGDINGDGRSDLIIGAYRAQKAYVIFGTNKFPAIFDTSALNGINGFTLTSSSAAFGESVAGLGDINGDDKSDLIIGTIQDKAYVVFGANKFPSIFDTLNLNGTNGFTLALSSNNFGIAVAGIGDLIGNDRSNLIIGAGVSNKAYVIFGPTMYQNYGMLSQIRYFVPMNQTDTTGKINIGSDGEWCNQDALFVGDFNGDGRSDLLCSMWNGRNYVMLSQLNAGKVTFAPMGTDPDGRIKVGANDKWCVKSIQQILIGDFNGDSKADLLCHNNQQFNQGASYVMLSTGDGFKPMSDSPDGYVQVGKLGSFCPIGGRLVIGNFDGMHGDDLLCNSPSAGNMIMVPNDKSFVSVNDDPLGTIDLGIGRACAHVWCADSGSVLMAGHFNNDNRTDLICNAGGENQIMLATFSNISCVFQPIYPASSGPKSNGWISMGQGSLPIWCDASKSKLVVADINGDKLSDLVCNTAGAHQIQLEHAVGEDKYEFISINAGDPSGDGRTKIADYDKWCNSQNLFSGDFSGNTLDDLWCNQNYSPVGEIYEEKVPT